MRLFFDHAYGLKNMLYAFQIADIRFDIEADFEIDWHPFIRLFRREAGAAQYHYRCEVCEQLPAPRGNLVYRGRDCVAFRMEDGREERVYLLPVYGVPVILYREIDDCRRVLYLQAQLLHLMITPDSFRIFNALAAEKMLMERDVFVLHASFVIHDGKAILFTAPSGTGKSTQAEQWVHHRGARQVNGDRVLIQKWKGVWYACGFPICGSSNVCLNERAPIRAVVYLQQGTRNEAAPLSGVDSVKRLTGETTMNIWNQAFVRRAMDQIEAFCADVPIVYYCCTKDGDAVDILEKYLKENTHGLVSAQQ